MGQTWLVIFLYDADDVNFFSLELLRCCIGDFEVVANVLSLHSFSISYRTLVVYSLLLVIVFAW